MLIFILCLFSLSLSSQEIINKENFSYQKKILLGFQAGAGWAFEDKANLFNTSVSFTIDYYLKNNFYFQFSPQYLWLWRWNEHYLTLPLHLRKKIKKKISFFAGPTLTFEVGHFKDLGVSGGAYYHFTKRSVLVLSAFTFTLYNYNIDYLYIPTSISYHININ